MQYSRVFLGLIVLASFTHVGLFPLLLLVCYSVQFIHYCCASSYWVSFVLIFVCELFRSFLLGLIGSSASVYVACWISVGPLVHLSASDCLSSGMNVSLLTSFYLLVFVSW